MLRRISLCWALLLFGVSDSKSALLHFEGAPALYNSGHEIWDVAVGDFDGDGRQDVVAAVESGIVFFRGNGDGTLAAPVEIASTPQRRLLAVDLEPDGRTDLIAWYPSRNVIWIFRGSSSGLAADTSYAPGSTVYDLKLGDLNSDGVLDLLASQANRLDVLLGTKGGRFGLPQSAAVIDAPSGSLALVDLNRDGRLDLACYGKFRQRYTTFIATVLGFGTGGFHTPRQFTSPLAPGPIVTADMTGDGKVDLVYAGIDMRLQAPNLLMVQPGNGDGTFGSAVTTVMADSVTRMTARDLNHDGRTDLLLASGSQVMSMMGNGDGSFHRGEPAMMPSHVAAFGLADLDGDGIEDLVAGTRAASRRDDVAVIKGRLGRAPMARCRDVVVEAGPGCVAQASIDDGSSDPDGDPITVVQSPAGPYPLGVTHVTLTCYDGHGAPATCEATVTVVDAKPPSLDLAVDRTTLWPPDRHLVPVHVTATSQDDCDEQPSITLESIVSSDPDPFREDIRGAAMGTADFDFELRAERSKASDRTYTICYGSRDDAGNDVRQCVVVRVQHDLRARADGTQVFSEAPGQVSTFDAGLTAPPGRGLIGLRYSIPHDGHVRISIYDVTGHRVARPVDDSQAAGWHQASFAGGNASQLLFYRVEWDGRSLSGRIPFLR